ncbi:hypothetical protein OWR29_23665 [Actinoplanes sp. Pm04-4]|uniref:Uncharacterized protein n=1 Tax=Paractinoplanes pyxinae TaxID=2997416 RepID=A0ABT4B3F0_9ACTN|nr:hypothetical protein [Actinoplanes pyxinae]MCY1141006.1 hypothetical protein [Actinoplanes pyxinae]
MPDHLVQLLLAGAAEAGEGGYNNFDAWSTNLRGTDADSPGGRLVTAHEALHSVLNDTTGYGMALAAYAVLSRHTEEDHLSALRKLVDACRGTHESFATFGSIWLVGSGDLALLAGYPDYRGWYQDAADLVPHLADHDRRKELMLEAVVRVCMQSHAVETLLGAQFAPDAWRRVEPADRPDSRFGRLHGLVDEDFWRSAWADCEAALGDSAGLAAVRAALEDPALRPETYDGVYSSDWQVCSEVLHHRLAGLLGSRAPTLAYDGHRDLIGEVIGVVERRAPHTAGLLLPSTDERTVEEESYEMWRRERLVVRDAPRPVRLARLEDLRGSDHLRLLSASPTETYVFCAVRPAFRMLDQFRFADADAAWLAGLGARPVVAARSGDTAGELDMVVFSEPDQLATVAAGRPDQVKVLTNVSLRCFGDDEWRRRWSRALTRTRLTALFDLSPFQQFDLWAQENDTFSFAIGSIRDKDSSPADVLAFRVGANDLPILLLCSAVTGDVLLRYLRQHAGTAREDPSILTAGADLIGRTISHLITEETSFDLAAYPKDV